MNKMEFTCSCLVSAEIGAVAGTFLLLRERSHMVLDPVSMEDEQAK
jgi:hypothetical protein